MQKLFLTFLAIILLSTWSFAQIDTSGQLSQRMDSMEHVQQTFTKQIKELQGRIQRGEKQISRTMDSVRNLQKNVLQTDANVQKIADTLGLQIERRSQETSDKVSVLRAKLSDNTTYWVIAVVLITLLCVLLFAWLKKRLHKEKIGLAEQIKNTSTALREEQLKVDTQLVKLLDTQMQVKQQTPTQADTPDHSLALKVADEIIRIQQNISHMDANTKGLKQLSASVKRIQSNFEANGYEIVDMLHKPYDVGMKVVANFKPDEHLKAGEQIITRIIKPQVNFKGVMIQSAQIEVSQGE